MTLDYDQHLVGKDYPQHAEDSGGFQADLFWDGSKLVPVTISRPNYGIFKCLGTFWARN